MLDDLPYLINDADNHFVEPLDMYERYIEPKWRDRRYVSPSAQADAGSKIVPLIAQAQSEVELELLGLDEQQIKRVMSEKRRATGSSTLAEIRQRVAQAASGGAEQV